MAKIYTKVGDQGQTSLVGGQKVAKSDHRLETYGTVDELNSVVGCARLAIEEAMKLFGLDESAGADRIVEGMGRVSTDLETLQHWLFDLGSLLASLPEDREKYGLSPMSLHRIEWLEGRIDAATAILPKLQNFILPGGSEPAARLHVARTVARRAERAMVEAAETLPENAIPFINRVSDYLFVMARMCNHFLGAHDVVWKKDVKGE